MKSKENSQNGNFKLNHGKKLNGHYNSKNKKVQKKFVDQTKRIQKKLDKLERNGNSIYKNNQKRRKKNSMDLRKIKNQLLESCEFETEAKVKNSSRS